MKILYKILIINFLSINVFAQSITLTPTSAGTNTEGKMYYSTSTHSFQYWNGTAFVPLGGSSAGAGWSATGNDITNSNTGNVGVGLSSPLSKFHIRSGGASGFTPGLTTSLFIESNSYNYLTIAAPNSFDAGILFGKPAAFSLGSIVYSGSNDMEFSTGATQRLVLKSNGLVGIYGNNALEFGYGIVGKEASAGKIGYGLFTPNTLDIVGAGNSYQTRKVKVWAEGGTVLNGDVAVDGYTNLGLGAPKIKMKLLTGTTTPTLLNTNVLHGLDVTKLLSYTALINVCCNSSGNVWVKDGQHDPASNIQIFDLFSSTTEIIIKPNSDSAFDLRSKQYRILITYME